MAWVFLLILIAWPVMEFAAFAQVSQWVGTPLAILGLFLSALLGTAVLRGQSLTTARKVQSAMNQGDMPVRALFDSAVIALAGLLLIIPGYVTDLIGLLLLLPFMRGLLYGEAAFRLQTAAKVQAQAQAQAQARRQEESFDSTVIEADYTVVGQRDGDPSHPPHDGAHGGGGGGGGSSASGGNRPSIRLLL